jgi:hypothetical protein
MFCHGWQNKASRAKDGSLNAVHVTPRKSKTGLAFLIFGQRNKTGTALRNLSINKPERTICANNIIRYITESQKRGSVFFYPFFT